ncbi:MAG: hypothetical protein U1E43_10515, partial [Rhodospirillales bacterium]
MATRIVAGIALGLPVLLVVWLGTPAFEVMVALAAGILAREWVGMTGPGRSSWGGLLLGCVVIVAVAIAAGLGIAAALAVLAVGTGLVLLASHGTPWMTLGALYIGLPSIA